MGKYLIALSTNKALSAIKSWLIQENAEGIDGNFWCNKDVIFNAHKRRRLLVICDLSLNPLGFLAHTNWANIDILEIKNEYRKRGIGTSLVKYFFLSSKRRRQWIINIECKPQSSVPFWEKQGFQVSDCGGQFKGKILLTSNRQIKHSDQKLDIEIKVFEEEALRTDHPSPYFTKKTIGFVHPSGSIQLAERIVFDKHNQGGDTVIELFIKNDQIIREKAKRSVCLSIGLKSCFHGYYLEEISSNYSSLKCCANYQ
jgi:hypothetical protein